MHFTRPIGSVKDVLKDVSCKKFSFGGSGRWGKFSKITRCLLNMTAMRGGRGGIRRVGGKGKGQDDISLMRIPSLARFQS